MKLSEFKKILWIGLTACMGFSLNSAHGAQPQDHHKIAGPDECAECHKATNKIWQGTHHFSTFSAMPRSKEARDIAKKMGIKRIKSESVCLDCHFTTQEKEAGFKQVIAGISCESCHAPAADWLERHSEFSGKKKEQETEQEAVLRWKDSEAAGMIRPHMLYKLAKNCYSCHITPNEKLVNQGGHSAGSPFELVSWSQGEVRHNVWHSDGKENQMASPERKRMMFIVGAMVELEESLLAVAEATQKAEYAITMAKRAKIAAKRMAKISESVQTPETQNIMVVLKTVKLKLNNTEQLKGAAAKVASAAQSFASSHDGSAFAAIDAMIPGIDKYKGEPEPVQK
ncbi:cytochrome c family protein [Oceanospirillum sediminis]|nr:cytochrome c family protein [Oceanospirillum sediminis]